MNLGKQKDSIRSEKSNVFSTSVAAVNICWETSIISKPIFVKTSMVNRSS